MPFCAILVAGLAGERWLDVVWYTIGKIIGALHCACSSHLLVESLCARFLALSWLSPMVLLAGMPLSVEWHACGVVCWRLVCWRLVCWRFREEPKGRIRLIAVVLCRLYVSLCAVYKPFACAFRLCCAVCM